MQLFGDVIKPTTKKWIIKLAATCQNDFGIKFSIPVMFVALGNYIGS